MKNINRIKQILRFFEAISGLQRIMSAEMPRHLKKYKLSRPQVGLMFYLSYHPDCTIKDIAAMMNISSSAATQIVEGIVRSGWVARGPDPDDRRSVRVKMSAKGELKFSQLKKAHFKYMQYLLADLSDKEMELLISIPEKIIHKFNPNKVRTNN